jgi:hypothetical protein
MVPGAVPQVGGAPQLGFTLPHAMKGPAMPNIRAIAHEQRTQRVGGVRRCQRRRNGKREHRDVERNGQCCCGCVLVHWLSPPCMGAARSPRGFRVLSLLGRQPLTSVNPRTLARLARGSFGDVERVWYAADAAGCATGFKPVHPILIRILGVSCHRRDA